MSSVKYDLVVVGGGVAGCNLSHYGLKSGLKTLLIDRASTVATGGSGAAGAFISPKLGKESPLLTVTNLAYQYATEFYSKNFLRYFDNSGVLRLPKDDIDAKNFKYYQSSIGGELLAPQELKRFGVNSKYSGLFFKEGGVCDAQGLCQALIDGVEFSQMALKDISFNSNSITINGRVETKNLVLATGYEAHPLIEYMGMRGTWGSRGDFFTDSDIVISTHKDISVSAKRDGVIKIGATHMRVNSAVEACMSCSGEPLKHLVKKAKAMVKLKGLELKETFCGMRSGSRDYFPVVGKVIDSEYMLSRYPKIKRGLKRFEFKYINNLYVLNGLGGRGFVLAPLLSKWLIEHIIDGSAIDKRVEPDRLFLKWARRLK